MEANDFWQDADRAQKVIDESNQLKAWTVPYQELKKRFEDVKALLPEAYEADDEELIQELLRICRAWKRRLPLLKCEKCFQGSWTAKIVILTINSGAGGTEACDWAQMLSRCISAGRLGRVGRLKWSTLSRGMSQESKASRSNSRETLPTGMQGRKRGSPLSPHFPF